MTGRRTRRAAAWLFVAAASACGTPEPAATPPREATSTDAPSVEPPTSAEPPTSVEPLSTRATAVEPSPEPAPPPPLRVVALKIHVDEEFRGSDADWLRLLMDDVAHASREFDAAFRIQLRPVSVVRWDSGTSVETLKDLYARCAATADDGDVDMFVSGKPLRRAPTVRDGSGGISSYFGRRFLVRLCRTDPEWKYRREVIMHEVGHHFGAWHTRDLASVMRPGPRGVEARRFDDETKAVVARFGTRDLRAGVDALTKDDEEFVTALFKKSRVADDLHPIASALLTRAIERWSKPDEASACLARAVALSEACEGPDGANTKYLRATHARLRPTAVPGGR